MKQATPEAAPMARAPMGPTVPEAGVMANEAADRAGCDAEGAGFAVLDPFDQHPDEGGGCGGDLGDEHGHTGGDVGGQFTPRVKAEPTDPEHRCAGDAHGSGCGVAWVFRGSLCASRRACTRSGPRYRR